MNVRELNKRLLTALAAGMFVAAGGLVGCDDDAGDKVEDAVDDAGDAVDDAVDEVDDAVDDAGDKIDGN